MSAVCLCARITALVCAVALTASAAAAQDRRLQRAPDEGGRRLALVIGNDAYPQMPLRNAVADARAMERALTRYDFAVDAAVNTTFKGLNRVIEQFAARLRPGDIALVYYAGHGMQVDQDNFLIPVDFAAGAESDVKYEAYSASRLVERLTGAGARLTVLILDACRNNPFRYSRDGTGGLAAMQTGEGTLIAFATAPNRTADDNQQGGNGLFTTHLLDAMERGVGIEEVFSITRQKVYEASGGRQIPWLVSSVIGDFHFLSAPAPTVPAPSDPANTGGADRTEALRWIQQNTDINESQANEIADNFRQTLAKGYDADWQFGAAVTNVGKPVWACYRDGSFSAFELTLDDARRLGLGENSIRTFRWGRPGSAPDVPSFVLHSPAVPRSIDGGQAWKGSVEYTRLGVVRGPLFIQVEYAVPERAVSHAVRLDVVADTAGVFTFTFSPINDPDSKSPAIKGLLPVFLRLMAGTDQTGKTLVPVSRVVGALIDVR